MYVLDSFSAVKEDLLGLCGSLRLSGSLQFSLKGLEGPTGRDVEGLAGLGRNVKDRKSVV